ncbi:MAG: hypothetical protein D6769_03465 [Methanobacteriota archaeon]|nr:MAG: hypothetical protein D6769_03465 [Euryarchaeota archaeon]
MDKVKLLEKIRNERMAARKDVFAKARNKQLSRMRASGKLIMGKDEEGKKVETLPTHELRIFVNMWWTRILFTRDNKAEALQYGHKEIEESYFARMFKRRVDIITHVIRGVRALRHIRENYEKELDDIDKRLLPLEELNINVVENADLRTIRRAIANLEALRDSMRKKSSIVYGAITSSRITDVIRLLKKAEEDPKRRQFLCNAAGASFWAVNRRLCSWREKNIAGIYYYDVARENSLRQYRDVWLLAQFGRYAEKTEEFFVYYEAERVKIAALDLIEKALEARDYSLAMRYISDFEPGFTDSATPFYKEGVVLVRSYKDIAKDEKTIPLITHYRAIGRALKPEREGGRPRWKEAMKALEFARMFVMANKPDFIEEELSKAGEPYIEELLPLLAEANKEFFDKKFNLAKKAYKKLFTRAKEVLP